MSKWVQISIEQYLWIYDYISQRTDTEAIMIRQEMDAKLNKILAHEQYSKRIRERRDNNGR